MTTEEPIKKARELHEVTGLSLVLRLANALEKPLAERAECRRRLDCLVNGWAKSEGTIQKQAKHLRRFTYRHYPAERECEAGAAVMKACRLSVEMVIQDVFEEPEQS